MLGLRAALFVMALLVCSTEVTGLARGGAEHLVQQKPLNTFQCKVMCQRFGMAALGSMFGQHFGATPQECCRVCDQVFRPRASGRRPPP
mmetsp:Transcript_33105/g.92916  ORF Transcript_33105/g.92916 Transcript_33105/m.92916 type:complete len:89 (-) Transcript_33105:151-417(-)